MSPGPLVNDGDSLEFKSRQSIDGCFHNYCVVNNFILLEWTEKRVRRNDPFLNVKLHINK